MLLVQLPFRFGTIPKKFPFGRPFSLEMRRLRHFFARLSTAAFVDRRESRRDRAAMALADGARQWDGRLRSPAALVLRKRAV